MMIDYSIWSMSLRKILSKVIFKMTSHWEIYGVPLYFLFYFCKIWFLWFVHSLLTFEQHDCWPTSAMCMAMHLSSHVGCWQQCIILADYLSKCKNLFNNSGKLLDNYCNQVCVSEFFVCSPRIYCMSVWLPDTLTFCGWSHPPTAWGEQVST